MNKKFAPLAIAIAATLGLAGCGGGSSSGSGSSQTPDNGSGGDTTTSNEMTPTSELQGKQVGSFQDAAVEGLTYWTASNGLGQTGENGSFNFEPGEVVALYIGNELVTLTDAELYSTPMDILSVRSITETDNLGDPLGHPHQGLNVLRLLQTIDNNADESIIGIPDSFHNDRNGSVLGLNFAQDTSDFANSQEVAAILSEASKQGEQLVDRSVAANHLEETLEGLDNNVIDLRGTWVAYSTFLEQFGAEVDASCENVGPATWVVGDSDVFLHGTEIESGNTCDSSEYGQEDTSDWPGVSNDTRNGINGVTWNIAENGALDFDCGPECTLAELRGTIDDWEEQCLSNDYYQSNNAGEFIDFNKVEYCAESDQHNGPVVGFSEITYTDRLGGDRILRVKRDFFAIEAPAEGAERADFFSDSGLTLDVMNRQEALDHTVDLTQGEWVQKTISATDTQAVDAGTFVFPRDEAIVPLECANGFDACTWEELNGAYPTNDGGMMQFIHVRGTNVVNWVSGDTVGTLTLAASN